MILPIGHEESATRRLPWVVFGILLVCFLVAAIVPAPERSASDEEREMAMEDAVHFWLDNRYLELDPAFEVAIGQQLPEYRSMIAAGDVNDFVPDDEDFVAEMQAELDDMVGWALETHEAADRGPNVYERFGLKPSDPSWAGFFTHMFMHDGWFHLLGNLFMLFMAGPALEDRWGRPLFSIFYLLAGLLSGLVFMGANWESTLPLVGASGAIAGVFGAFLVRFWHTKIRFAYLFMFGFRLVRGTFWAPAKLMLPLWLLNEILQAWFWSEAGIDSGIAYSAHIGGFLFGVAVAVGVRFGEIEEKYIHDAIEGKITLKTAHPAIEESLAARQRGEGAEALMMLARAVDEHPDDPDLVVAYLDAAAAEGRAREAVPAMTQLIRADLAGGSQDDALRHWIDMTDAEQGALMDPASLMRIAPVLAERGDRPRAILALRHVLDPENQGLTVGFALRALELAKELDPRTAVRAIEMALALGDMHEGKRAKLEAMAAELRGAAQDAPPTPEVETTRPSVALAAAGAAGAGAAIGMAASAVALEEPQSMPVQPAMQREAIEIEADDFPDTRQILARAEKEDGSRGPRALSLSGEVEDDESGTGVLAAESFDIMPPPLPAGEMPPPLPQPDAEPGPLRETELADVAALAPFARFHDAKIVDGIPKSLGESGLRIDTAKGRQVEIAHARVQAVAVAAVGGLADKPVVLVDLLFNWNSDDANQLQVLRLRSDRFDPRSLTPGEESPIRALREFLSRLLRASGAVPLPTAEAVRVDPIARFEDLSSYHREVLQTGS